MKLFYLLTIVMFSYSILLSQENGSVSEQKIPLFEAGVILGEPVGLNIKYWYSELSAADFGAAWSFTENGIVEIFSNFLVHFFRLKNDYGLFPFFSGAGIALRIGNDWFFGAQVPIGAEWLTAKVPFSVTGQIAPQWQLVPKNRFVMSGGLAIRLTFGTVR